MKRTFLMSIYLFQNILSSRWLFQSRASPNLSGLFQVLWGGEVRRSNTSLSAHSNVRQTHISHSSPGRWTSWHSGRWFSERGEAVGPVELARLRLMSGDGRFEKFNFSKSKYNPRWRLTPSLLVRSEIVLALLCGAEGANCVEPVWVARKFQTQ